MKTQTFRTEARVDTSNPPNPLKTAELLLDAMAEIVCKNSKAIEAIRKVGFTADPDKDGRGKHFPAAGAIASMSQMFTHSGPHKGPADYFTLSLTTKVHFDPPITLKATPMPHPFPEFVVRPSEDPCAITVVDMRDPTINEANRLEALYEAGELRSDS